MKNHLRNRISFKLARTAVLIAFVVGSLLSGAQVYLDYRDAGTDLVKKINESQRVAEKAATRAVFLLDAELAEEVALGFTEFDYVVGVVIMDDNGNALTRNERAAPHVDTGYGIVQSVFNDTEIYDYDLLLPPNMSENPGKLRLFVSRAVGLEPFFDRAITIFLSGLLRNFLLAMLLYWVFYQIVSKPLRSIVEKVAEIDPEHPGERRVNIDPRHKDDEFGLLAGQINQALDAVHDMVENLRSSNRALISSEEMLRMRSWELEQEVERAKRTSLELISTKEKAEAANRAKSVFLANVSHELRTPLNAIIGFSSIMADEMFGPIGHDKYHQYLQDIRDSSQHLSEVLGEVLDLAKIEAGELTMEEEEVDMHRLFDESISLMSAQALQKGIKIENRISDNLPPLLGDRLRIKQSVLNLISNAVKFTPRGQGSVMLGAGINDAGEMFICVKDNGIGIASEEQDLIFAPFIRSSSAHSRSHEGTGLGLSLVRAFMEVHGGRIEVESQPGMGSSFSLVFPPNRVLTLASEEKSPSGLAAS